ncbi:class I SAM-dependent methyltransferase [Vagococcus intermedius]|uniref:Methyltransferase domain-containing protein n=1 Tax=Vagococcus intermedius TaxID=2991418 RepID=A0AAF0CUS8_9ENTE|nr:class I SAM-dependent methyltransferase [Vagococcus intermedius]WEG73256.1 methyltransferase domain-containing protein [Vagococcus intermedius]WEG75340.1 methyltransferase domain-containing protein [Vagococcus intermedius]
MLKTALNNSHELLTEIIEPGDLVVDGTVGNGFDTLFLAKLVGKSGKVIGFDVQEQAINTTTEKLLAEKLLSRVDLHHKGHEALETMLTAQDKVKAAIFNLGYLPKSDKSIITKSDTTLTALKALLSHLTPKGRIIIVIYYGHEGGLSEKDAVLNYVKNIPQADFNVLSYQFINQKNNPPILIAIEKKAKKHAP